MANLIEFLIVGRTPLGGALRAGLIGVAATAIGTLLFSGFWGPLGVGAVVVVAMLPVAYALSRRDNPPMPEPPAVPPTAPGEMPRISDPNERQ